MSDVVATLAAQLILVAKSVVVAHDQAREIRTVDSLVSIPLRRDLALARIHSIAQQQASTAPPPQEEEEHSEEDPVAEADELVVESQTQDVDSLKATLRATKRTKNFWRLSPFLPNSTTAPAILAQPCSPPSNSENQVPLLPPLSPIPTTPALPTSSETVVLRIALDEKVAKEVMRVMKGMYFSFEFDITNSLQRKHEKVLAEREKLRLAEEEKEAKLKGKLRKPKSGTTPSTETTKDTGGLVEPLESEPIYRRADERFWWNRHLVADFVNAEDCSDFLVVLQQGFITSVPFTLPTDSTSSLLPSSIPATPAQGKFIIISRRSIERPGLRYMRRGTNEKGGVANFVETEFIISVEREGELHIASFIQTRGSIPIFWSQSPWSIKPIPVLDRPAEENLAACKSHFDEQIKFYGRNVIVNLAEGGVSKEAIVVDAYRNTVEAMKEDKVKCVFWLHCIFRRELTVCGAGMSNSTFIANVERCSIARCRISSIVSSRISQRSRQFSPTSVLHQRLTLRTQMLLVNVEASLLDSDRRRANKLHGLSRSNKRRPKRSRSIRRRTTFDESWIGRDESRYGFCVLRCVR